MVGSPANGLPDGQTRQLIIDQTSPARAWRIFVGVKGFGVFCSEDGGATWGSRNQGLPHGEIRDLVQHPVRPASFWAVLAAKDSDLGGLYGTEDAGRSWRRLGNTFVCPDPKTLKVSPADPGHHYLATRQTMVPGGKVYPGGVFASSDGGATWGRVLDNHFIQGLAVDTHKPEVVYAGGDDHAYHDESIGLGVMASNDGASSWRSLNSPSLTIHNITCLTVDPHQPNRLYTATMGNGVFVRYLGA